MGVRVTFGATALTWTLNGAHSTARLRVESSPSLGSLLPCARSAADIQLRSAVCPALGDAGTRPTCDVPEPDASRARSQVGLAALPMPIVEGDRVMPPLASGHPASTALA